MGRDGTLISPSQPGPRISSAALLALKIERSGATARSPSDTVSRSGLIDERSIKTPKTPPNEFSGSIKLFQVLCLDLFGGSVIQGFHQFIFLVQSLHEPAKLPARFVAEIISAL